MSSHPFTNRLAQESSPYLLQHAHNPVDWFPWGEEALAKAKEENRVILVSIGYSACHWCHVMERESFENEATAMLMNKNFINIKIDREERPDLDHIYMDAVQAMSGSGGWPLNVFLTPDARPFFGGTYFPPVRAFNRASWTEVLNGIAQSWQEKQGEIESQAAYLTEHISKSNNILPTNDLILPAAGERLATAEQCRSMFSAIMQTADTEWGGFGNAPKFPQTFTVRYLLQYHYFTGNEDALRQALLSIDQMLLGGIYDHVGGGLARYSTDQEWLAPHFEKMLYDNALLINILCDAYQLTRDKKYERAIRKTISFITNELLSEEGGFYAALDADSEGEEGKFYVWQKQEIDEWLGAESELFCSFFDVTQEGNWEHKNILRILKPAADFAREKELDPGLFEEQMDNCLRQLYKQRSKRVPPLLDDKIILGWNAMLAGAIARAATVLEDDSYRALAVSNVNFLLSSFSAKEGTSELQHTYKNGVARYPAFLDDYANLIAALIQLYKATFDENWLKKASDYSRYVVENFSDEAAIYFFFTSKDQKDVIVRKKEIYDGAVPSGNSLMAENLLQLAILFDKSDWRQRAEKMLMAISRHAEKYPGSFGIWASLLLQQNVGINEIAVIGTDFVLTSNKILLNFIPNLVMMSANRANPAFPLLADKAGGPQTSIYLCWNYTCLTPFSNTDILMQKIDKTNKITT